MSGVNPSHWPSAAALPPKGEKSDSEARRLSRHRRCRRRSAEWRDLCRRRRLNTMVVAALEVAMAKDYAAAAALRRGSGGSCGVRGGAACATAEAQLPFQLHPVGA